MGLLSDMDGIRFETLRRRIDQRLCDLHDGLSEAYYGDRDENGRWVPGTGWRNGTNASWLGLTGAQWAAVYGLDPRDPATAKKVFDDLHGRVHDLYFLVFHEENQKEAVPYPREEYDPVEIEEDGSPALAISRLERARQSLRWIKANRSDAFSKLKAWVTDNGFAADETAGD